jgi:hypothetical protein
MMLSALLTLALLQMWVPKLHRKAISEEQAPAGLSWLLPLPIKTEAQPEAKPRAIVPPRRVSQTPPAPAKPAAEKPAQAALPETASPLSSETNAAQENPPTSTLKLDGKTIAQAYKDSRSDIQKMADAAGKQLQAAPAGKYEQFQTALEEARIPDCTKDPLKHVPPKIGPVTLGGFLVVPFIVKAVVTGKCK